MDRHLSSPRVSVALCTYNGEQFVSQQLESIGSQTHPVDEIVICDDGSVDGTLSIIQSFSALPIRLERNSARLGITKNFEKAISLCSGDVIFLCDQDDRWMNDKVQILLDRLMIGSVGMVFSNAQVVSNDLSPLGYRLWDSIWFNEQEQQRVRSGNALPVLLKHAVAAGSTMAFRTEYRPLLLPIPDLPHSHDIWIALLLSCVGEIEPVDQDLIQYRLHSANEVGMRQYGFLDQIRMARQQIRNNAFFNLATLHEAAYQRLTSQTEWAAHSDLLVMLQDKIRHSRRRHELSIRWPHRLMTIIGEMRQNNYRRFSYGWKSVLQDLFLR